MSDGPKPPTRRAHATDLRATAGLVVDATKGVVDVVENMHTAIGAVPIITPLVYKTIRGVTDLVGTSLDAILESFAPLLGEGVPGPAREHVIAALNGVVGDHLEATGNPLAIRTTFCPPLPEHPASTTLLVLVHGSAMCHLGWARNGHDYGAALAGDLGFTATYLSYNSGRHISDNGRDLDALLERESAAFHDILLVGHSMGGLVARSAIRSAEDAHHAWRDKLRALVTIATPHHGAGLERAGNVFETLLGVTKYSAPLRALGKIRSAGVTDLRFGNVVEEDWRDRDRFAHGDDPRTPVPLPAGVRCYAIAATTARSLDARSLPGDGLVPVDSALGRHPDDRFTLRFTDERVVAATNHLGSLSSPEVYGLLRAWLSEEKLTLHFVD